MTASTSFFFRALRAFRLPLPKKAISVAVQRRAAAVSIVWTSQPAPRSSVANGQPFVTVSPTEAILTPVSLASLLYSVCTFFAA